MKNFPSCEKPVTVEALICFFDLTNFAATARRVDDSVKILKFMQGIAHITANIVRDNNGLIIKYIGDAGLILFPDELVDSGVKALIKLQKKLHDYIDSGNFKNRVTMSMHYGEISLGKLEPIDRPDCYGDAVNIAAVMPNSGPSKRFKGKFIITPQVFRKLKPETRKLVHKFTPPIVYMLE